MYCNWIKLSSRWRFHLEASSDLLKWLQVFCKLEVFLASCSCRRWPWRRTVGGRTGGWGGRRRGKTPWCVSTAGNLAMVLLIVQLYWKVKIWVQESVTGVDPQSMILANARQRSTQLLVHFHMQNASSVVRWDIYQGHVLTIPKDCMPKVAAADFVALWSTTEKTVRKTRT